MIKFPAQEVVIKALLNGMMKAVNNFLVWTNNRLFLSHGPHKIISIHVAQEIATIDNAPEIFIDATIADILRCSLNDREAYKEYMHEKQLSQGSFDITLDDRFEHKNNNDSISRVIVTVKNGVRNAKQEHLNEIEKICKMLDRKNSDDSTLDYGVFAFYSDLSNNARKKLHKRLPEIEKKFDEVVKNFSSLKSKFIHNEIQSIADSGEWVVGCYVIEPVN